MEKKIGNMKKILVGFDGSEGSEQALNRAMGMINQYGEIILLAVVSKPDEQYFIDEELYENMKIKAQNLVDQAIIDMGHQEIEFTGMVQEGNDPAAVIIDVASRLDVDLIVLGSRGESELGSFTMGSVANKVVQYAAKPVMVVR